MSDDAQNWNAAIAQAIDDVAIAGGGWIDPNVFARTARQVLDTKPSPEIERLAAAVVAKDLQQRKPELFAPAPPLGQGATHASDRNRPCLCGSGKKRKRCCGA